MNEIVVRQPRELGLGAQPTLRLALGKRDPSRGGAPVKTDHFVASSGADGEFDVAARKFHEILGEKPRAVPIILPASLEWALDIRYKAWASAAGAEDGGVMRAIGRTNFAMTGQTEGPDVLTIWEPDGTVVESDISGLDDPLAVELGLRRYTELRFHIPDVLGITGWAVVSTQSGKSTDNLYRACRQLYHWLGPLVPEVVRPKLVLRRAHARPIVITDGKPKRIKSKFWALDLYVPDTWTEIQERVETRSPLLPMPGGAVAALPAGAQDALEDAEAIEASDLPFVDVEPVDADEIDFGEPGA